VGPIDRRPLGSRVTFCFVIVLMLFSPVILISRVAQAEWSADVTLAPDSAYSGAPFDYAVHLTNTGETTIRVKWVNLTIVWPFSNPEWGDPSEHFIIFSGERNVTPGSNTGFVKQITSNMFGGFATNVSIVAIAEGEENSTVGYYFGSIHMASAPATYGLPGWEIFIVLFLVFFAVDWLGFQWGKFWWSHEIENALRFENPGLHLLWKWFPYYWENSGKMWLNYILWLIISAILAFVFALALGA